MQNKRPETEPARKWAKDKKAAARIQLNIFGRQPVLEALRSHIQIEKIWLADGLQGHSIQQIKNLVASKEIEVEQIRKDAIQKIVGAVVHQGVAARVRLNILLGETKLADFLENKTDPLILILDQIQDPHNLGAILRTAEISGTDMIIMPLKGSAEISATVAKTSAGALFHIPIYQSQNILETFETLHSKNIKIYATLPRSEKSIYQVNFKQGAAIVVGNEGQGVRKNLIPYMDESIFIPQKGRLNSLNASVSTAVVLYEAVRQRQT